MYNQPYNYNKQGKQEQENTQPVDAMHVFHPLRSRLVRIGLAQVQVFGYLAQYIHKKTVSQRYS